MKNPIHKKTLVKKQLTKDEIQDILHQLDGLLDNLRHQWDQENTIKPSWWKMNSVRLIKGTQFIIRSLDHMIQWVEDLIPTGTDKKAAVTLMVGKLFDYIVAAAFPIWLRPFAPIIRKIVIDIIIGNIIDFIVAKYNEGIWKKDVNDAQEIKQIRYFKK
jgi:hypothetical protein